MSKRKQMQPHANSAGNYQAIQHYAQKFDSERRKKIFVLAADAAKGVHCQTYLQEAPTAIAARRSKYVVQMVR